MKTKFVVIKLSSPQLVDNCTYGTIAFLCIKNSLEKDLLHSKLHPNFMPDFQMDDAAQGLEKNKLTQVHKLITRF